MTTSQENVKIDTSLSHKEDFRETRARHRFKAADFVYTFDEKSKGFILEFKSSKQLQEDHIIKKILQKASDFMKTKTSLLYVWINFILVSVICTFSISLAATQESVYLIIPCVLLIPMIVIAIKQKKKAYANRKLQYELLLNYLKSNSLRIEMMLSQTKYCMRYQLFKCQKSTKFNWSNENQQETKPINLKSSRQSLVNSQKNKADTNTSSETKVRGKIKQDSDDLLDKVLAIKFISSKINHRSDFELKENLSRSSIGIERVKGANDSFELPVTKPNFLEFFNNNEFRNRVICYKRPKLRQQKAREVILTGFCFEIRSMEMEKKRSKKNYSFGDEIDSVREVSFTSNGLQSLYKTNKNSFTVFENHSKLINRSLKSPNSKSDFGKIKKVTKVKGDVIDVSEGRKRLRSDSLNFEVSRIPKERDEDEMNFHFPQGFIHEKRRLGRPKIKRSVSDVGDNYSF